MQEQNLSEVQNYLEQRKQLQKLNRYRQQVQAIRNDPRNPVNKMIPIQLALDMGIDSILPFFKKYEAHAEQMGISIQEAYEMDNSTTSNVKSLKLVGSNGIGKTQMVLKYAIEKCKGLGLNPVIYSPKNEDDLIMYPTSAKDCLILHYSCVGKENIDLIGIPLADKNAIIHKVDKDFNKIMKDGIPVNFVKSGQSRTYIPLFYTLSQFPYAIIMFDEMNRSPESHTFNALLNGEKGTISYARYGTIIIATQNSQFDGMNLYLTQQDAAAVTKTQTYLVYNTVSDWQYYISDEGIEIHPALMSFLDNDIKLQEALETPNKMEDSNEIGFPTFRGMNAFSDALINLEKAQNEKFNGAIPLSQSQITILTQAILGRDTNHSELPERFAEYYIYAQQKALPKLIETFESFEANPFKIGFHDKEYNNVVLQLIHNNSSYVHVEQSTMDSYFSNVIEHNQATLLFKQFSHYLADYLNKMLNHRTENAVTQIATTLFVKELTANANYRATVLSKLVNEEEKKIFTYLCDTNNSLEIANNKFILLPYPTLYEMALNYFYDLPNADVYLQYFWQKLIDKAQRITTVISPSKSDYKANIYRLVDLLENRISLSVIGNNLYRAMYYNLQFMNTANGTKDMDYNEKAKVITKENEFEHFWDFLFMNTSSTIKKNNSEYCSIKTDDTQDEYIIEPYSNIKHKLSFQENGINKVISEQEYNLYINYIKQQYQFDYEGKKEEYYSGNGLV